MFKTNFSGRSKICRHKKI